VDDLYRVRKRSRLGGIGQPELYNEEEVVQVKSEFPYRESEEGWVGRAKEE
jgi:hypothetical protein